MSVASFDLPASFSLVTSLASQKHKPAHITVPWIREATFGQLLGFRANALAQLPPSSPGPADLIHWGRHYGEWLSRFSHNEFAPPTNTSNSKEDGYVGYYHFCNGIDYSSGANAVEEYVMAAIGLEQTAEGYFWRAGTDVASLGVYTSKQMVVTLCTHNMFARAELRARFLVLVPKSRKSPVSVDSLYTVTQQAQKRVHSYTWNTVGEISDGFWRELAVSSVVRLFYAVDDPSRQVCGTVAVAAQVQSKSALLHAIDRMVAFLPRGSVTGTREALGVPTGTDGPTVAHYRNRLVDALIRLVMLDMSGDAANYAITTVQLAYGSDYDIVVCRLLRAQYGTNNDMRFLEMVHQHLTAELLLTQAALLMVEQVRFLIGRGSYDTAEKVAARTVELLPLDFDCWYHLALCQVLSHNFEQALYTINALPVVFTKTRLADDSVDGVYDWYAMCFMQRQVAGQDVLMETFEKFFPPPQNEQGADAGSVDGIWYQEFTRRPQIRHPLVGAFYASPLASATPIEILAIDSAILKVAGPETPRQVLAARLSGNPWTALDLDRTSTWGRTYDLVTMMVALIGWDNLVHAKNKTFRQQEQIDDYVVDHTTCVRDECEPWLDQLLLVVYDDIKAMTAVSDDHNRSALAWAMIGMIGWSCKYNLKDSVSALVTSVAGVAQAGGFDYFGTVRLLEIYNEFVLSDVDALSIDRLSCVYERRSFSNKLIVQSVSPQVLDEFARQLVLGYLLLEQILLHLMKYVSWNLRWHQYVPSHLATTTLIKLCIKYDTVYVQLMMRVVFETYRRQATKKPKFSVQALFGKKALAPANTADFAESDSVLAYMERIVAWIESLQNEQ